MIFCSVYACPVSSLLPSNIILLAHLFFIYLIGIRYTHIINYLTSNSNINNQHLNLYAPPRTSSPSSSEDAGLSIVEVWDSSEGLSSLCSAALYLLKDSIYAFRVAKWDIDFS
jgi:hypothetical protein